MLGLCKKTACAGCTKKVKGTLTFTEKGPALCVEHKGSHGKLQPPQGGSLWTCAEALALEALETKRARVTAKDVRAALQEKGLKLRCSNAQLHSFVTRFNSAGPQERSSKGKVTLSQLENAATLHMTPHMDAWEAWKVWRLIVLPNPTFDEERVCIVWTCPGMLRRAQALQEKVLKMVVDAKQRMVSNEYGIVTLSFLVSGTSPSKTWAGQTHTKSVTVHTATQEPFVQALVNSESEPNMTQVFTEACNLAEKECGLDLRAQVWQLHKDYAKGIEASRRKVFPHARPCDDYAHMRRASYKVLQKYLPGKPSTKPRQSRPQSLGSVLYCCGRPMCLGSVPLPVPLRSPKKKSKSPKKKSKSPKDASEVVRSNNVADPPEPTPVVQDGDAFGRLEHNIHISREVPTMQLFDAIWQLAFPWLQKKSAKAEEYLRTTYFQKASVDSMQKGFRCTATLWGAEAFWFSGFWGGVLGTYPGSSSGTQTLESFHAYWQNNVKAKVRQAPTEVFAAMEGLFRDEWADKFAWEEEKAFVTWPTRSAEALFNSQSLRSAGRSPAVDFWQNRELRLCGNRNYREVYIRTGEPTGTDREGITTFWVLQSRTYQKMAAAEAIVPKDVAEIVANLIASEGAQLAKWLLKAGIVSDDKELNLAQLDKYLQRHCAVMEGHLVQAVWPRAQKKLKKVAPAKLCTCREFLLHADCEHVLYIKALQNDPTANLQNIPVQRPRGRKRKL